MLADSSKAFGRSLGPTSYLSLLLEIYNYEMEEAEAMQVFRFRKIEHRIPPERLKSAKYHWASPIRTNPAQ